jgi:HEAT repeats
MPNKPEWETSASWQQGRKADATQEPVSGVTAPRRPSRLAMMLVGAGSPSVGERRRKVTRLIVVSSIFELILVLLILAGRSGALESIWDVLSGHRLGASGKPVAAGYSKLSEHEREYILRLAPQKQAEELLTAAINHDEGATDLILQQLPTWQGRLRRTKHWTDLEMTALYSNDLRVRAATIEADIPAYGMEKSEAQAEQLIANANADPRWKALDAWELGMLANRGIATERIHDVLVNWLSDPNEQARIWAVEGLALIGTDDTTEDLLRVLGTDPSMAVRERAGCSLAKSGMRTRAQRMRAIPGLIELAFTPSLDATTRSWVYQALREIANENIGNDPEAWRQWWQVHGQAKITEVAEKPEWSVRGNN